MIVEDIREFLSDWTLAIASILGLVIAWNNTKETVGRWFKNINLYRRMGKVEEEISEHKQLHVKKEL